MKSFSVYRVTRVELFLKAHAIFCLCLSGITHTEFPIRAVSQVGAGANLSLFFIALRAPVVR